MTSFEQAIRTSFENLDRTTRQICMAMGYSGSKSRVIYGTVIETETSHAGMATALGHNPDGTRVEGPKVAHHALALRTAEKRYEAEVLALRQHLRDHIPALCCHEVLIGVLASLNKDQLCFNIVVDRTVHSKIITGPSEDIIRTLIDIFRGLDGIPAPSGRRFVVNSDYTIEAHDPDAALRVFAALHAPENFSALHDDEIRISLVEVLDTTSLVKGLNEPYQAPRFAPA